VGGATGAPIRTLQGPDLVNSVAFSRFWKVKGPGLVIVVPIVQQMVRVDLRIRVLDVPPATPGCIEPRLNGYRLQVVKEGRQVRLYSAPAGMSGPDACRRSPLDTRGTSPTCD
jgi:hypothetical protein